MKKSLIALAVLAASGAAMAQSSVTLFGVVDAAVSHGSGDGGNKTSLSSGGLSSSRIGFRGVEDLGGGLKAGFHLEAGLNADNGSLGNSRGEGTSTNNQANLASNGGLTFNRRSTVSLMGNFGEVRLGRDYTPQHLSQIAFDPFGTIGVGALANSHFASGTGAVNNYNTNQRASNSIAYHAPNMGGFYGTAMYHMGENLSNAANKKVGNGLGFRAGFAQGPFDVAVAYTESDIAVNTKLKAFNLGGSYDLGMAKVMALYSQDKNDNSNAKGTGFLVGGLVPVGAGQVRLAYSTYKQDNSTGLDPKVNKISLGYVHNLSKRTALYATYAHLTNKNDAGFALNGATGAANQNSNGYDFGLRHSF